MGILAHGIGCMRNAVIFQRRLCTLYDYKAIASFVLFTKVFIYVCGKYEVFGWGNKYMCWRSLDISESILTFLYQKVKMMFQCFSFLVKGRFFSLYDPCFLQLNFSPDSLKENLGWMSDVLVKLLNSWQITREHWPNALMFLWIVSTCGLSEQYGFPSKLSLLRWPINIANLTPQHLRKLSVHPLRLLFGQETMYDVVNRNKGLPILMNYIAVKTLWTKIRFHWLWFPVRLATKSLCLVQARMCVKGVCLQTPVDVCAICWLDCIRC